MSELRDAIGAAGGRGETRERRLRARAVLRLHQALTECVAQRLDRDDDIRAEVDELVEGIAGGEVDPYTAAARIIDRF